MPKNEDECPICEQYMDVLVSGYRDSPFIDGKRYEKICFICSEVPQTTHVDENGRYFYCWDVSKLSTVEEMAEDGFDKKKAAVSIKAVKASIKKHS